ncbi:MAG TPA: HU family DNA-binding protein [Vicinamibacteria bacterium]|jgi:DNA-binding protein HU-beta|nr:HU family DNA-binding protein [Vicinamibacteria bacterium]
MNRAEVVGRVARDSGLTKADVDRVLGSLIENVSRSLKKGEKVKLVGFGTFDVARRRARSVLNPRTGAAIRIPARRMPRFTPGKDLKKLVR